MARADLEAPTLAFQQGQKGRPKAKLKNKLLGKKTKTKTKHKKEVPCPSVDGIPLQFSSIFQNLLSWSILFLASLKGLRREAPLR